MTMPQRTTPLAPSTRTASGAHLRVQRAVATMWLQGASYPEIADALIPVIGHKPNYHYVLAVIKAIRGELREFHRAELVEDADKCVETLKMVQQRCWQELAITSDPSKLLNVIVRAEETVAKIRGVLTERVQHIGDLVHHIKLYDFQDRYPKLSPPNSVAKSSVAKDTEGVVEGEYELLPATEGQPTERQSTMKGDEQEWLPDSRLVQDEAQFKRMVADNMPPSVRLARAGRKGASGYDAGDGDLILNEGGF